MTEEFRSRYEDGRYLAGHEGWHDEDAAWKAEQVQQMIEEARLRPTSICDIGCGTAGVLANLADRYPHIRMVGYERAAIAATLANERHPEIQVVVGEPGKDGVHYDLALMLDVFEHVDDYLGFLRQSQEVADYFIFHVPLDLSVQTVMRMRPILEARRETGHLHYFTKETALATLHDVGYNVIRQRITRSGIELHRRSARTRVAAIPRRIGYLLNPDLACRVLGGFSLLALASS